MSRRNRKRKVVFVRAPAPPLVVGGTGGNYEPKLVALQESGRVGPGQVGIIDILRDDWCAIYDQRACNCDPDIYLNAVAIPVINAGEPASSAGADHGSSLTKPQLRQLSQLSQLGQLRQRIPERDSEHFEPRTLPRKPRNCQNTLGILTICHSAMSLERELCQLCQPFWSLITDNYQQLGYPPLPLAQYYNSALQNANVKTVCWEGSRGSGCEF